METDIKIKHAANAEDFLAAKYLILDEFVEIPAYRFNPYDEARYFELDLMKTVVN